MGRGVQILTPYEIRQALTTRARLVMKSVNSPGSTLYFDCNHDPALRAVFVERLLCEHLDIDVTGPVFFICRTCGQRKYL